MSHLVLASGSPRRQELLSNQKLTFDVRVSSIEEIVDASLSPEEVVISLAYQKATDVAGKFPESFVIGADTVVLLDNEILGKPQSEEEAAHMLKALSGRTHHVLTGVAIVTQNKEVTFAEITEVTFWDLTEADIKSYVASGEPMDKAGSYGIQELGAKLVKRINGDYFSVVGLPVSRTIRELKKLGFE